MKGFLFYLFFCVLWATNYRWDASWTSKGTFHGWNINWFGQFHHIPNDQFSKTIHPHSEWNSSHLSSPTSTRNLRVIWWYNSPLRWTNCVSRSKGKRPWVLWLHGFQMSREKRSSRLFTRSTFIRLVLFLIFSLIWPLKIILNSTLYILVIW